MKPEKYEWLQNEIVECLKLEDKLSRYDVITAVYDTVVHYNGGDATPFGDVELYVDKPKGYWS